MKLSDSLSSKLIERISNNEAIGGKGWSTVLAEFPIYEGLYYAEVLIKEPKLPLPYQGVSPHVRIGIGQKQANMELPLGAEDISYCYRDRDGNLLSEGVKKEYGADFTVGDIIGVLVYLPPPKPKQKVEEVQEQMQLEEHISKQTSYQQNFESNQFIPSLQKIPSEIRCRESSCYDQLSQIENQFSQQPKQKQQQSIILDQQQMAIEDSVYCDSSFIYFFKNGENQGRAFQKFKEGFYYLGCSLYMHAKVAFNFGPLFQYPPNIEELGLVIDEDVILKPYDQISKEAIPYNDLP